MIINPHLRLRWENKDSGAGILVITCLMIAVMSMMAAAILYKVSSRHAATYHSLVWNEALSSAEAGADLALLSLNNSFSSPGTAWAAWTPSDATTFPKTYVPSIPNHSGEGNTKVYAKVTVDKGVGSGWIRVRSTGVAELPGRAIDGLDAARTDTSGVKNHRSMLRKASYKTDVTAGVLRLPQVARTIEVLAAPSSAKPYVRSLTLKNFISMSGSSSTDSFNSANPAYSTGGQYDFSKRLRHGDIATNISGNFSNLRDSFVYGDASSNGGTIQNASHVQGTVTNNFQTTIPDIADPVFPTVAATPTVINNPSAPVTLTAGTAASPTYFKLSALTISNTTNHLILAPPSTGQDSYINIWVTGKTTVSGSGWIQVQPGVHVKFWCDDDITISGNGFVNENNVAAYAQLYGVTPSSGTKKITISGSGAMIAVINAPAFDLTISGSGDFMGAGIANSVTLSGSGTFHYDEDLSNLSGPGAPASYTYSSWAEDIR